MISKALLIRYESQTDEDTMDTFLEDLSAGISWEEGTQAWFGIRYMRGEFGVFTCFDDEAARDAHLTDTAATRLFEAEHRLLSGKPRTTRVDVLACKMPTLLEGVTKGLVLRFKAKPGKEAEVARLLHDTREIAEREAGTLAWFANHYDNGQFGTFAAFADNGGRFAHLTGQIPRELGMTGLALLGGVPEVYMVDVMAGTARKQG